MARRAEAINLASAVNGKLGGRPVGAKSKRGRPKKAPSKVSKLNSKLDVLQFLADVFQDRLKGHSPGIDLDTRLKAAAYFANYKYPKLQAQHITHGTAGQSHAQWVKEMAAQIRQSNEPELKLINGDATEAIEAKPKEEQRKPDMISGDKDDNA